MFRGIFVFWFCFYKSVFNLAKKNIYKIFLFLEDFKINSKIIIFCLILCLIFSITSVSASDVNTTDNQVLSATPSVDTLSTSVNTEQNNNTQSVSENNLLSAGNDDSGSNELLGADEETGSFTDLNKLISLSSNIVVLNNDYAYDSSQDTAYINGLNITKSITIEGNGHRIDCMNASNAFNNIVSNNVTIKNIIVFKYLGT